MNSKGKSDILLFAEDPGAANYIAPLPKAFTEAGYKVKLLAAGKAIEHFKSIHVSSQSVDPSTTADQLLDDLKPNIVMVGTSDNLDSLGLHLIQSAKKRKILSIGVIDASMSAPVRFSGKTNNPLEFQPDWLFVPDEWTKQEFLKLGFKEARTLVCGHPLYDRVLEMEQVWKKEDQFNKRMKIFSKAPKQKKIGVFLSEYSNEWDPEASNTKNDYTLKGHSNSKWRSIVVVEEFLEAIKLLPEKPYLVFRLHPKDDLKLYGDLLQDFDEVSSKGNPLELVWTADFTVGMTTTLLLEAAILNRPTLSIVPREIEKTWLPCTRNNVTPCIWDRKELHRVLPDLLTESPKRFSVTANSTQTILKSIKEIIES